MPKGLHLTYDKARAYFEANNVDPVHLYAVKHRIIHGAQSNGLMIYNLIDLKAELLKHKLAKDLTDVKPHLTPFQRSRHS